MRKPVLAAVLLLAFGLTGAHAEEARKLSGPEIAALISGNTVEGAMAATGPYQEFYLPDGTIRGSGYTGKWSVVGDTLCFAYDPAKPADCWSAAVTPANEIQWLKDGKVDGTGKAKPGNVANF
ncbi:MULTISPECIES: hypothetical protein [unclassified Aureimonas]|uniref:hypothetical protein n=1 Tax=unclassified Aureimonas TaxID=2615206 RepID=UPI000701B138|nr:MULTISPECIES: hypothetical protein [unclassified Aureimonas]KQT61850.1 hypothetical protein ASG62_23790 [Aureimonas sp. Leaf427]KQT74882.1 hypothetical protein ASG54_03530 [Aureimonas sp. Leaf460]